MAKVMTNLFAIFLKSGQPFMIPSIPRRRIAKWTGIARLVLELAAPPGAASCRHAPRNPSATIGDYPAGASPDETVGFFASC